MPITSDQDISSFSSLSAATLDDPQTFIPKQPQQAFAPDQAQQVYSTEDNSGNINNEIVEGNRLIKTNDGRILLVHSASEIDFSICQ